MLRKEIEAQALTVALGVSGGRLTFEDLKDSVPESSALKRAEAAGAGGAVMSNVTVAEELAGLAWLNPST